MNLSFSSDFTTATATATQNVIVISLDGHVQHATLWISLLLQNNNVRSPDYLWWYDGGVQNFILRARCFLTTVRGNPVTEHTTHFIQHKYDFDGWKPLNLPGNGYHQGDASEGSTWLPDKQNCHATVFKGTEYRLGCGCQRCDMRNASIATQVMSPIEFTIRLSAFSWTNACPFLQEA